MFYGEYEHTVDEKNRLTLPARFRNALAGGVVLARGIERNIDVYPRESWDANVARMGRVLLPPPLAEHAGLGKDVLVAGVHDHIEIWDRAVWADHLSAIEGS